MRSRIAMACLAAIGASAPIAAQAQPAPELVTQFSEAGGAFAGCLTATVQMGMTTRMDPEAFKIGLAKSCLDQQAAFRKLAIEVAVANGKTEVDAAAEVDGNIARGRSIYAADQESYVLTGRVPQ